MITYIKQQNTTHRIEQLKYNKILFNNKTYSNKFKQKYVYFLKLYLLVKCNEPDTQSNIITVQINSIPSKNSLVESSWQCFEKQII